VTPSKVAKKKKIPPFYASESGFGFIPLLNESSFVLVRFVVKLNLLSCRKVTGYSSMKSDYYKGVSVSGINGPM
jgi:hypothetical protein